jgi:hypothetical protein
MSNTKQSPKELMGLTWSLSPSGLTGFTTGDLETAAAIDSAQTLRRVEQTLLRIEGQMRSLGADGLHELIRLQLRVARAKDKARRTKAKALRDAKKGGAA